MRKNWLEVRSYIEEKQTKLKETIALPIIEMGDFERRDSVDRNTTNPIESVEGAQPLNYISCL